MVDENRQPTEANPSGLSRKGTSGDSASARVSRGLAVLGAVLGFSLIAFASLSFSRIDFAWNLDLYFLPPGLGVLLGCGVALVGLAAWLWIGRRSWKSRAGVAASGVAVAIVLAVFSIRPALHPQDYNNSFAPPAEESADTPGPNTDAADHPVPLLRFAAVGDAGYDPLHSHRIGSEIARYSAAIGTLRGLLLLGDNLKHEGDFNTIVEKELAVPFAPILEAKIPIYAALGNHDYSAEFVEPEVRYAPLNMKGRRYYSETFGGGLVTVFFLDSQPLMKQPAQIDWLRRSLDRCQSQWKVLALHHPVEASDMSHGPSIHRREVLQRFFTGTPHVDVVLSGHNHLYERRRLLDGVLHVTSGSGCTTVTKTFPPDAGRAFGYNDTCAFAVLTFTPDTLHVEAINELGHRVDEAWYEKKSQTGRLRPAPENKMEKIARR